MRTITCIICLMLLLAAFHPSGSVQAQLTPPFGGCADFSPDGTQIYRICLPAQDAWNGQWVVFAHGYVPPYGELTDAWDHLVTPEGGVDLPATVTSLGFGFAASTYRQTGLAVVVGLEDTINLGLFLKNLTPASHLFLTGGSEGGLIATLAMEKSDLFDGAVAACGPIGDFRKQINYLGDLRVLFDYYFPTILPPSAINIDPGLYADWQQENSLYQQAVENVISTHASRASEMLRVAKAAYVSGDVDTYINTTISVLNFNVSEMEHAKLLLGVQPYSNRTTWYYGSSNDLLLNRQIKRYGPYQGTPEDTAINRALMPYQTTGRLTGPLVTIHNTSDAQDPVWHQTLYRLKVWKAGSIGLYTGIPIPRYGHCNFTVEEMVFALGLMVLKTGMMPYSIEQVKATLPDAASLNRFDTLRSQYGDVLNQTIKTPLR